MSLVYLEIEHFKEHDWGFFFKYNYMYILYSKTKILFYKRMTDEPAMEDMDKMTEDCNPRHASWCMMHFSYSILQINKSNIMHICK